MGQSFIVACAIPQALGEGGASAHVGAGFEGSPEMTDTLFEGLFAQGTLASFDTLAIKLQSLGGCDGDYFGENNVGVGAIRGNGEGLSGQRYTNAWVVVLPGVVDEIL